MTAPRLRITALPALALLALFALSHLPSASAQAAKCSLSLEPEEFDRLAKTLADSPKRYLTLEASGEVTGVKVDALRADGFSDAAVQCMVATYQGGDGVSTAPTPPSVPQRALSEEDKAKVYAYFTKKSTERAWRKKVSKRFGKSSTKGLNNKAMTTALDGTFDPTLITSIFDWLSAALGITLPPWLQLLGPAIALILQLAIFL